MGLYFYREFLIGSVAGEEHCPSENISYEGKHFEIVSVEMREELGEGRGLVTEFVDA